MLALADVQLLRVAVASPALRVADVDGNVAATLAVLGEARARGARLVVCPELGLTGYTCADLFFTPDLRAAARAGLVEVAAATGRLGLAAVVGLPLEVDGRLFNVAAVCAGGVVVGFVPKTYLPTYGEYYEERWFASARELTTAALPFGPSGAEAPVAIGPDLLFTALDCPALTFGVEICEDLWAVEPPSGSLALGGATLLCNPSASVELLGKPAWRRDLVRQQSSRTLAAYLYAGAGPGESTTDAVYGGHSLVAEAGRLLAESPRLEFESRLTYADVDLGFLAAERLRSSTFTSASPGRGFRRLALRLGDDTTIDLAQPGALLRPLDPHPFVPADPARLSAHCEEIFALQSTALTRRLRHTGVRAVTLGLSGGLDSTLAALVAARAFDAAGLPRSGVHACSLPGFGTTSRTRGNAARLASALGFTFHEIPIEAAVRQHFADIGHDPAVHDITFENSQARERTQILMDLAHRVGGWCLGTGDLSEAALGWCTFNGDHMSNYHVNAGVPKTLVRSLVAWAGAHAFGGETAATLADIVATPITPELLPPAADGSIAQRTEDLIGPYDLLDFFLFHFLRHQASPALLYACARQAFAGRYGPDEIERWLLSFLRRFFAAQFKRNACPDGPKIGTVALSPRADWRMPSDATADLWLRRARGVSALG